MRVSCTHVLLMFMLMCVTSSTKPRGRLPCAESFVQRLLSCTRACVMYPCTAHVHAHVRHLGLRSREVDYPALKVLSSDCFHVLMLVSCTHCACACSCASCRNIHLHNTLPAVHAHVSERCCKSTGTLWNHGASGEKRQAGYPCDPFTSKPPPQKSCLLTTSR